MLHRLDRRMFVKSVRNWRNGLLMRLNRRTGREFIPGPRTALNIETSSVCNLDCFFKKMGSQAISIYGHDLASFKAITKSIDTVYFRLVRNLELLLRMKEKHDLEVFFIFHTGAESLRGRSSELMTVLDRFKQAGCSINLQKGLYNNWGGYVADEDVKHLPIRIVGRMSFPRTAPASGWSPRYRSWRPES